MDFDLIVIGSGLGGYAVAKEYRRLSSDSSILILTQDDGVYYSKPMLSTGFAKKKTAEDLAMKSAEKMAEELTIQVNTFTEVTAIDRSSKQVTTNKGDFTYKHLVFATGAAPIKLPLPEITAPLTYHINDLMDYATFNKDISEKGVKKITIIGSGLVGTEYATDLTTAGYDVDVIALDEAPLQLLLPKQLGLAVQNQLEEDGVTWHFQTSIAEVEAGSDHPLKITLQNGKILDADLILSAVGLRPRAEIAKAAGINVNRGIITDQQLRTNDPDVYALGDCAEICDNILMYVLPLNFSAKALAKTLAGDETTLSLPAMPVVVKTPTCPVVSNPPKHGMTGEWHVEGEGSDLKATFIDTNGDMQGFALTGAKVAERIKLAKQLPPLL